MLSAFTPTIRPNEGAARFATVLVCFMKFVEKRQRKK